ncbi:ABC transporter permease [Aureivirga marina]|uniref:ABC transporter permease n=1 Tax=Aureivirga marina TaxID=1182451 RepID=UPI0018CB3CD3|nr:ABC transporter permease [Aureivirga marina]
MLKIWFKIFYRNSRKNWLHTIINLLGLTLGLVGFILVSTYYFTEKSYNQWNPNKDNIYRIVHQMKGNEAWDTSSEKEGAYFLSEIPEVESIYYNNHWYQSLKIKVAEKDFYTKKITLGQKNFFEFFPFKIVEGSMEKFSEVKNHVAISEEKAKLFFGEESAIGKTIELDGVLYKVATVFERNDKSYFNPNIILQYQNELNGDWGNFSKVLFCKLSPNADVQTVQHKMNAIFKKYRTTTQAKLIGITPEEFEDKYAMDVLLESLSDIRLKNYVGDSGPEGSGDYKLIMMLFGLSIVLIIISVVNVINLAVASILDRAKEVGIKKTLGLSNFQIFIQYVLEVIINCLFAFLLSLIIVELLLPYFSDFMRLEMNFLPSSEIIKIVGTTILLAFLIALIPGIFMVKFKSIYVLKGNIGKTKKGVLLRNIMVGIQFIISGFFLIGTMVIYSQVNYLLNKDVGFSGEQVLVVMLNEQSPNRYKKYELLKKELIKHPNIEFITSAFNVPNMAGSSSTTIEYKDVSVQSNTNAIDFGYFNMVNSKILKGRSFEEKYVSDTIEHVLLNETAARKLGIYEDPIGKKIQIGYRDEPMEVIGLVEDYHARGFNSEIKPTFILHWKTVDWIKQFNFHIIQFKIKEENIQETIAYIENYWQENIEQGYPFVHDFLDKRFARYFKKYQKQQTLFLILSGVVILIALLGLYALSTLTIRQRYKEIAIRKTLGASDKELMKSLLNVFLKVALIASIIVIPLSFYLMQLWLDNFAYRIEMPITPFVFTPIILILLVLIVVGVKAYNATKVDITHYLKYE